MTSYLGRGDGGNWKGQRKGTEREGRKLVHPTFWIRVYTPTTYVSYALVVTSPRRSSSSFTQLECSKSIRRKFIERCILISTTREARVALSSALPVCVFFSVCQHDNSRTVREIFSASSYGR